jgi:putative ABC transport system ATP-binding protein
MLEVRGVAKRFGPGPALLDSLSLDVARGEWVAVVGESGSGKSTLLNLIAGLDRPDHGEVRLDAKALPYDDDDALALWRRRSVGFVFQAFHLLPYLSVAENVALPLALLEVPVRDRAPRVEAALASVGLGGLGERRPSTLSGGEMQRAAIARALIHSPALVLADEPTGNLDEANAGAVLECLRDAVRQSNACALMVTHSARAAAAADRVLRLAGGRLAPERA